MIEVTPVEQDGPKTFWVFYAKMVISFVGDRFCWTLCFHDDFWWCHAENCYV